VLQFNWGMFWAILAALAARKFFTACWFAFFPKVFTSMDERILFIQDRLQEIADDVDFIKGK